MWLLPLTGYGGPASPPLRWQRLTGSDRGQPVGWQPFLDDEVSAGARYDIDRQRCPPSGFLRPLQHQALQRAVRVLHMTMPAPAITPRCSTAQRRRRRRRSAGQHWPVTQRHPPSRQHRNVIHTVEDRTHVLRRRDGGSSSPRSGITARSASTACRSLRPPGWPTHYRHGSREANPTKSSAALADASRRA